MTNCLFRKYWYLTVVAVLFFASASFAQTMDLTSAGDVIVWNGGNGVYVDPYQASIGGGTPTTVICDDWANNTYLNEQWNATTTMASALPSGGSPSTTPMFTGLTNVTFGTTTYTSVTQAQLYDALAFLGSELFGAGSTSPNYQIDYSFAMWELDYAAGRNSGYPVIDGSNPTTFLAGANTVVDGVLPSAEQGNVTNDIVAALNTAMTVGGYNDSKWEILTPSSCPNNDCQTWPAQEFLVDTSSTGNGNQLPPSAPESSATLVFGADMLGLLGLAFIFRRRLLRTIQ